MVNEDIAIRIRCIRVRRLFGLYNHVVTLKNDRVTVLHGPNGVGKTVLLKLVNNFIEGRYSEIARVPFELFEIEFDDQCVVEVQSTLDSVPRKMQITLNAANGVARRVLWNYESSTAQETAKRIEGLSPWLSQIGVDAWIDGRSGQVLTAEGVIERAGDFVNQDLSAAGVSEPVELRQFRQRFSVHLIQTQRLLRVPQPNRFVNPIKQRTETTSTVIEYSDDLRQRIETALANYGKYSQSLDQSFPQRLLHGMSSSFSTEELKAELQKIGATRERLVNIGLLDSGVSDRNTTPLAISELDSLHREQLRVMSVYARDTAEKLSVLEELSDRLSIFLSVLKKKFINKNVCVSRVSGIAVSGNDGKKIPLTALSSGEQHELVLLYDMLFKVKPNALVLIDEPELSLHILWQKEFMQDLLQIISIAHFDVLLATHSPYIVGERDDLLVELSVETVAAERALHDPCF